MDSLSQLVRKAFPNLQDEAREQLALNRYMDQLKDPQISFAVKQRRPQNIQEAVSATIELQSYLVKPHMQGAVQQVQKEEEGAVAAIKLTQASMLEAMQKLVNRVEQLEAGPQRYRSQRPLRDSQQPSRQRTRAQPVVCYRCGQVGHFARGCTMRDIPKQFNEQEQQALGSGISGQNVQNMSINNVSSYTLTCIVNGTPVSSLIDTGAGVCLLKSEVWEKVKSKADTIEPITAHRLVGVDGIPIKVQGSATICFTISGVKFQHKFIIADRITADAILGVDFLEANKCILNLAEGELSVNQKTVALSVHPAVATVGCAKITLMDTVVVPASSEMEIRARVHSNIKGVWLVDGNKTNKLPVCVARALVTTPNEIVPLRVVNTSLTPTTLYRNSKIAIAEQINESTICGTVEGEEWVATEGIHHKPELLLAQPLPQDIT